MITYPHTNNHKMQLSTQCLKIENLHIISSFMTYHRVCNKSNTTGATCRAGTTYPSEAPEFNPGLLDL